MNDRFSKRGFYIDKSDPSISVDVIFIPGARIGVQLFREIHYAREPLIWEWQELSWVYVPMDLDKWVFVESIESVLPYIDVKFHDALRKIKWH